MTAFKSTSRSIKDALITVLTAITYDAGSGAEPAFGLVTDDPALDTTAEPFVLVYPAPSENELVVVGQMDRTTSFDIIVTLNLENGQRTQVQTYNAMYDITELILDCLDNADWNDAINTLDNTLNINLLTAKRSTFYPAKTDSASVLLCTISVSVKWLYDL